jgi:hypothetical protein
VDASTMSIYILYSVVNVNTNLAGVDFMSVGKG